MLATVVVPTYNEAGNIEAVRGRLLALPVDLEVIVVDDGSPNGTGARADAWAARDRRVRVIQRGRKLGLSVADCTAGFRCYRRETQAKVDLETIRSSGYSFLVEILFQLASQKLSIGEVKFRFEERRAGTRQAHDRAAPASVQDGT